MTENNLEETGITERQKLILYGVLGIGTVAATAGIGYGIYVAVSGECSEEGTACT